MDKEAVVHIYMEYYSAIKRNVFESVLMKWMNLYTVYNIYIYSVYIL